MSRLHRNASAVRAYIVEVWPRIEKPGGVPDVPFGRKHKGTTRPPTTDRALRLMDANRHASKILAPLLNEVRAHDISYGGIRVNSILFAVEYDAAAARGWKAENAPEDDVLWKLCLLLARAAQANWDGKEIAEPPVRDKAGNLLPAAVVKEAGTPLDMQALGLVVTSMPGEPDDSELQASEWQTAHNRDNNFQKKTKAEDSYKRIYPKWTAYRDRMEAEEPTASAWAIREMFCEHYEKEHGWPLSQRKLGRVIAHGEGTANEEWGEEGRVTYWRDLGDGDAA